MIIDRNQLYISALRALLFNITSSIRFIFIQSVEDKLILFVYTDKELSESEKDIFYAVSGEISGDFPFLDDSKSEVNFVNDNNKFESIKNEGDLIFARYEE